MSTRIGRREFITLLGGAAAWPLGVRAQEPAMPVVGFLGSLSQSAQSTWTAAFVQRMREHGWIEGRTVAIEYRWAEGRVERSVEIVCCADESKVGYCLWEVSQRFTLSADLL